MPAAGYTYSREQVIDKEFFKGFLKVHPELQSIINYDTFKDIILESNQLMFDTVANDDQGIKLPENMGYVAVTKYKSKKKARDWANSIKYGKVIYHLNLHSFGFIYHIKWFKAGIAKFAHNYIYKFEPNRFLKRAVAANVKSGKPYLEWNLTDFWSASKLQRAFNKRFKISE